MVRSDRGARNLYERLEEARIKRAEVLALKKPANDVANIKTDLGPDLQPAQDRFPSIVMPTAAEPLPEHPSAPRRPSWHIRAVAVIIAVIGIAHLMGSEQQPLVGESVDAQTAPPLIDSLGSLAPSSDKRMLISQSARLSLVEGASPQWPASGTPAQKPSVGRPPGKIRSPNFATATDAQLTFADVTLLLASPARQPLLPTNDTKFAITMPVELTVSLNIPRSASASEVKTVAAALDQSGLEIRDPRIVNFRVKATHIRFFHASDATAATKLAKTINGTARDFTNFVPAPPSGYVEVWIMGRPAALQSNATSRRPLQALGRDLRRLRADLRNALRSSNQ